VVRPVPGAAGVRQKLMPPRSSANASNGSARSNAIGVGSPRVSSRRSTSWSRNWPHTQPHCVTSFSEKRFWPTSLKIRLLTYRAGGAAAMLEIPSAYAGAATRGYRLRAAPQEGWRTLLPLPSSDRVVDGPAAPAAGIASAPAHAATAHPVENHPSTDKKSASARAMGRTEHCANREVLVAGSPLALA
jgi:hypothetical protein